MDRYLLGIDYGGTVTKAAVFDSRGRQISVYSEKTEVVFPGDGRCEIDPVRLKKTVMSVIRGAVAKSGVSSSLIACVGISGHGKGLYVTDKNGDPVFCGILSSDTRVYFEENLERCVRYASSSGVILAFETMETDFMNTTEKAMRYVERINSPYLQIYPDIGNVTNGAEDPAADLAAGKGRLVAAHLKETAPGIFRDLRYGEGRVDFETLVPLLYGLGVRIFTCEFWYREGTECQSELRYALEYMKKFLK